MALRGIVFGLCMVLLAAMLTGCAKAQPPAPPKTVDANAYFPLEPGMTWIYEGEGNEYASFTRRVMYMQGDLAQISEDNGGTIMALVFRVNKDEVAKIFSEPEFYTDENLLNRPGNINEIIIKTPVQVGTNWEDGRFRKEIVSIDEKVQVPAGTFDQVLKIKILSLEAQERHEQFEYYAKGKGLIMREFITGQNDRIVSRLKTITKTEFLPQQKKQP